MGFADQISRLRPLLLAVPLVLFTACALQPPTQISSSESPTSTIASTTPTQVASTPIGTPVMPPTVGRLDAIVLGSDAIGGLTFGSAEKDDLAVLINQLGEPDEIVEGTYCELVDDSPYSTVYTYGGLSVIFLAKDAKSTSARTLQGWTYVLEEGLDEAFAFADDLPADPTFEQLQGLYPAGRLQQNELGTVFTLPNKIRFIGSEEPNFVAAGPASGCE